MSSRGTQKGCKSLNRSDTAYIHIETNIDTNAVSSPIPGTTVLVLISIRRVFGIEGDLKAFFIRDGTATPPFVCSMLTGNWRFFMTSALWGTTLSYFSLLFLQMTLLHISFVRFPRIIPPVPLTKRTWAFKFRPMRYGDGQWIFCSSTKIKRSGLL